MPELQILRDEECFFFFTPQGDVERKLSQMILDEKFHGRCMRSNQPTARYSLDSATPNHVESKLFIIDPIVSESKSVLPNYRGGFSIYGEWRT